VRNIRNRNVIVACVVFHLTGSFKYLSNYRFLCGGNYQNNFLRCLEDPEASYNFSKATAVRFAG